MKNIKTLLILLGVQAACLSFAQKAPQQTDSVAFSFRSGKANLPALLKAEKVLKGLKYSVIVNLGYTSIIVPSAAYKTAVHRLKKAHLDDRRKGWIVGETVDAAPIRRSHF